jgi:hypothetical protein
MGPAGPAETRPAVCLLFQSCTALYRAFRGDAILRPKHRQNFGTQEAMIAATRIEIVAALLAGCSNNSMTP